MLSDEDRRTLLSIARASMEAAVAGKPYGAPRYGSGDLAVPRAAFVTCRTLEGQLRGCIGHTEARWPTAEAVARMARAAATQDPRFPPVQPQETPNLRLEISLLSEPQPITPEEIEIGTHGLIVQSGFARGLLLPQVAVEQGWDVDTFLAHTCLKAGLPKRAWREAGTSLYGFTAEVFGEPRP